MPTCRRKRVLLTQPSNTLLDALKSDPQREVYYLAQTGEIFETYEYMSHLIQPSHQNPDILLNFKEHMLHECPSIR